MCQILKAFDAIPSEVENRFNEIVKEDERAKQQAALEEKLKNARTRI